MNAKLTTLAAALVVSSVAFPANAEAQTENIAQTYVHTVRPENIAQFEAAVKRHVQWRKQNDDPWDWVWYQFVNGDGLGRYRESPVG